MSASSDKKGVGVVIPCYGHPRLLVDAVTSACRQDLDVPITVVVVDDGCRFEETGRIVHGLLGEFPDTLHYIRKQNGGLSSARNAGIDFLMEFSPDLEAIYFLDADNKLETYALSAFRAALGEDETIGWAYPDITFFGLTWGSDGFDIRETAPQYSFLKHLLGNISEAGSMVRASVFSKGVRFDETMKFGFEDWDFWLSVLEHGYRGTRVRNSGFLYRRRPESMLAESRRLETELIAGMRRKHKELFAPKFLMAKEHEEAPFFALVLPEQEEVVLTSDPLMQGKCIQRDVFLNRYHQWRLATREHFFPAGVIVLSTRAQQALEKAPFAMRPLFWALKESNHDITACWLEAEPQFTDAVLAPCAANSIDTADLIYITAESMLAPLNLLADLQAEDYHCASIQLPISIPAADTVEVNGDSLMVGLRAFLEGLGQPVNKPAGHLNRRYAGPSAKDVRSDLIAPICAEEERQPYPACTGNSRCLLVLRAEILADAADREEFLIFLKRLDQKQIETIVVIESDRRAGLELGALRISEWAHLVADINLDCYSGSDVSYKLYQGSRLASRLTPKGKEDGLIRAKASDFMVSFGGVAGYGYIGQAKTIGVPGFVYFGSLVEADDPLHFGLLDETLAYEHAISGVIDVQGDVQKTMSGGGFPIEKFIGHARFWKEITTRFGKTGKHPY